MAYSKQSKKRIRQHDKRRLHNASMGSMLRTYIKKVLYAVADGDYQKASAAYKAAVPVIDRMTSKGLIHKNKAARHKSRLNGHIKALQSS